jgi:hypothetical protein
MTTFNHPPRILFLYGSLRERSYSRLLAEEAARIITDMGAEVKFFRNCSITTGGDRLQRSMGLLKNCASALIAK